MEIGKKAVQKIAVGHKKGKARVSMSVPETFNSLTPGFIFFTSLDF